MLASAGDDGNTLLWVPSETQSHTPAFGEDTPEDKETWRIKHMCRSSGSEIYDLAWSPDGVFFITGSMDNIARIYNAQSGQYFSPLAFQGLVPSQPQWTLIAYSNSMLYLSDDEVNKWLIPHRTNGTTDSRAQSLCARCSLGPT